ncbi:MAG: sulfatase [Planctomycetota bacterium]
MIRPRTARPQAATAAALSLAALLCACSGKDEPAPPNVVLISIDSLRPDHLGCYGYRRATSPEIDRFAREGMLFESHFSSAPWTLPAHAALFTSVPDSVHGLVDPVGLRLADEWETLPESFQRAGYRTAGFFAGPYLHPSFGFGQGFDSYEDCASTTGDASVDEEGRWSEDADVMKASHRGVTNNGVYARWRAVLDEVAPVGGTQKEPLFAFVHLWDVHFDFTPPAPFDTMFDPGYEGRITGRDFFWDQRINALLPERDKQHIVALYDGEIRWTDTFIGRIRADLEERGMADDTIVVLTADHGTELFDHGGKGHRTTLYDEQIKIPLIVWWPGRIAPDRHDSVTRMIDVGPTLRDLCGMPAVQTTMGHSLAPLARGETDLPVGAPAVVELMSAARNLRAIRTNTDKLVHNAHTDQYAWYELISDPGEREARPVGQDQRSVTLLEQYEEIAAELAEAVLGLGFGPSAADVPDAVRKSLRGLGYFANPSEPEREVEDGR